MHAFRYHTIERFSWRDGQSFELLIDGHVFFDDMLVAIHSAKSFIYFEMYLVQSGHVADRFIEALLAASHRGVQVKLLLDDYGTRGFEKSDREKLQAENIVTCFYNPLQYGRLRKNLFRDHRKLLLVDGVIAYTGGAGITDDFDRDSHPDEYWHEAMIKVRGDCVQDWKVLFESNWQRCSGELLQTLALEHDAFLPGQMGRVVAGKTITHSEVIRSFVTHIRGAQKCIWLASAYFVPSRKIRGALLKQARDGVDVRLLLPGPRIDHPWARHMGRRYYERLLSHGVRIFEYQPRFTHVKMLLCDHWVSIGSSNVDRWNFKWNLEANQEVEDEEFSNIVQDQFKNDFADSREILLREWVKRSWWVRLKVTCWSAVARVLSWLSFHRNDD